MAAPHAEAQICVGNDTLLDVPQRAREKQDRSHQRENKRRQWIAEGVFESLDRLSCACSRLRHLRKVDCEGYMEGLAHNVLKAMRRLPQGTGPLRPLELETAEPRLPIDLNEHEMTTVSADIKMAL